MGGDDGGRRRRRRRDDDDLKEVLAIGIGISIKHSVERHFIEIPTTTSFFVIAMMKKI